MRARFGRRGLALVVAMLAVLGIGAGIAVAVIPAADGTITGCYKNVNGQLRVIDADDDGECLPSETMLTWNQTGPQGPAGEDGEDGVVLGFYRVDESTATNGANEKFVDPECAVEGDKVVSGGWSLAPFGADNRQDLADHINIIENNANAPAGAGFKEGWRVRAKEFPGENGLNEDWQLRGFVICADLTP